METKKYDFMFKIIFLGSSSVGKTALLTRFCDDIFTDNYIATIGADFRIKTMNINEKVIKIHIWDTAGQERYQSIASNLYKGSHGVICVFDLSDRKSFEKVKEEMNKCRSEIEISDDCCLIIGNKSDLKENEKVISPEEAHKLAKNIDAVYFQTSAKTGENVQKIFEELVKNIIEQRHFYNLENSEKEEKKAFSIIKTGDNIKEKENECLC